MSASSSPTLAPAEARLTARLTATVVFPTPPLPLATAMMFFTPLITSPWSARRVAGMCALVFIFTSWTPGTARTAVLTFASISARRGQAGVVRLSVNETSPPSTLRSSIMPNETTSLRSSGSFTDRKASRTCSLVTKEILFCRTSLHLYNYSCNDSAIPGMSGLEAAWFLRTPAADKGAEQPAFHGSPFLVESQQERLDSAIAGVVTNAGQEKLSSD